MTAGWYAPVLARMPEGARCLDVGIGTAAALCRHADVVHARDLRVVGVDIDRDYVASARSAVARAGLADRVEVRLQDAAAVDDGPYDAVYFSGSFMLIPDQVGLLQALAAVVRPGAPWMFTQTFEDRPNRLLERAKPWLHALTSVRFGEVTYREAFDATLAAGGLEVVEATTLSRRARGRRAAVLIVAARAHEGAGRGASAPAGHATRG